MTDGQILPHALQLITDPWVWLFLRIPLVLDMYERLFEDVQRADIGGVRSLRDTAERSRSIYGMKRYFRISWTHTC